MRRSSRFHPRGTRRVAALGPAVLAATLVGLVVGVTPSAAVVTCSFAGTTATVTLGAGDSATIARSGNAIHVNGAPCDGATVNNTDLIDVNGDAGDETVTINLTGGPFAPGATDEGDGTSEIEWDIDLAGSGADTLVVQGTGGKDLIWFGTLGANLNAPIPGDPGGDDDADATLSGIEAVTVNAGAGADGISGAGGEGTGGAFGVPMTINGGFGKDVLTGGTADDTVNGQQDQDNLNGGLGDDTIAGGSEHDTAVYQGAPAFVTVDLTLQPAPQATGGAGTDTLTSIESLIGSSHDDVLTGNDAQNFLVGEGGNDTLNGGAGNDFLAGKAGNDTMDGGDGNDTARYDLASSGVTVNLGIAGPQPTGGAGTDTLTSIENLEGSVHDDILIGDGGDNRLEGRGGADVLEGKGGTDTADYTKRLSRVVVSLDDVANDGAPGEGDNVKSDVENVRTGFGNDTLIGAPGIPNVLNAGAGTDTVNYKSAGGPVNVNLSTGVASADGGGAADTLVGIENATGSPFADVLIGKAGRNVLRGLGGKDRLNGLNGNDLLVGGAKKDVIRGGNHNDVAKGGGGPDRLLGQNGRDTLRGNNGNDTIKGGAHNDKLFGNRGDDLLDGGAGTDKCVGGAGADVRQNCES